MDRKPKDVTEFVEAPERSPSLPKVVIAGAGFGGLSAALALKGAPVEITLLDKRNYHLFQPLLYQVATAGLSPADIAQPIRSIVRDQENITVMLATISDVDLENQLVITDTGSTPYDYLIMATGATHAYFGNDHWETVAPGLKTISDATEIRQRVLTAFERAETTSSEAEREALLNFAVIGGGPTGVEMAGAIVELARKALARDFRNIDPTTAHVVLIEAGPRVLPSFPEELSAKAQAQLEQLGVKVRTGEPVTHCDPEGIVIGESERLDTVSVIWAAGVAASPAARWLGADADQAGRTIVTPDLTLPSDERVFVIGDTALSADAEGTAVPGVAPAAKQMGQYVANSIRRRVEGKPPPKPFAYRDYGNMATIGRKSAVADFGKFQMSGLAAWLVWGVAHIYFLIGFRNRLSVALHWMWSYVTFDRGARLITK